MVKFLSDADVQDNYFAQSRFCARETNIVIIKISFVQPVSVGAIIVPPTGSSANVWSNYVSLTIHSNMN